MAEEGLLRYQVLDPPGNAIRLLNLLPGQFSDDVHLSIIHERLQDEPRTSYECLSYTWGSATQAHEKLYIWQKHTTADGEKNSLQYLNVRTNLMTALRYLRLPDSPRVLWIDAVCIDQSNLTEKGQEVGRMGQIYNKASRVVVWLGPEDESTPLALDIIQRISAGVQLTWNHRGIHCTLPGSEAQVLEQRPEDSALTPEHWMALSKFLRRPWFSRLWIRQEVQLASEVRVLCGTSEVDWESLEKMSIFVEHKMDRKYIDVEEILFCRSLFRYMGSDSLTYTLHRSSLCKYFDPRDLIYANLSTSTAMAALHIAPDYSLTPAQVYKDMTLRYISHFQTLDILRSCDLETCPPGFSSFVPDYATPKSESRLFAVHAHAGSRQSYVETGDGGIVVKGVNVDVVCKVSPARKPLAVRTHAGDNHADIIATYRAWEPVGLMESPYPLGGTLLDAFVLLLSNGFCKDAYYDGHLPTFAESRDTFTACVWSGSDAELRTQPSYRAYVKELISDRRGEVFFTTEKGYLGVSPASVKAGDVVAVLLGASVPIVLRPQRTLDARKYQIVGPCYIQGLMFGEGLLGPLPLGWMGVMHETRKWCFQTTDDTLRTWEDPRLWSLPGHWRAHYCDIEIEGEGCQGDCEIKYVRGARLADRWFLDTRSGERRREDPRLTIEGLEEGGVELESFKLV
ncbi:HET-domain-containing protein [Ophiobolus disseminans]|uniref:HET-domain-containing protein n=1 Tax=Ophiobolus disseminans TaxID=1469910 RepID=A0A6A7AC32_9PLEO|nr:HET-domain-containing protein [Ophiobolus disseminans]